MTGACLVIQRDRRELLIDGSATRLGARAFDVLAALAWRRGQFISKSDLLDLAWPGLVVEENNLEVQVSTLRRLLGRDAILTVPGRGYSFVLAPAPLPGGAAADALCFTRPPAAPSAAPPHNLPQPLTSFIGRDADIAELLTLSRKTRLLTLTGAGGCGKTRLSIELAKALLPRFADGAWLVELAAVSDPALLPQTVATALGLRAGPAQPAHELLVAHLAARSALLVLDNAEHLLPPCVALVGDLLGRCAGVTVLVSSRALLGITGEMSWRVPSLRVPDARLDPTPQRLAACDAVRLFVERAQLHRPAFVLDDGNAAAVARICIRLDGIPLALELAAARLRALALDDVARRLDHCFELLVGGSRTALPRHQTLRALIDWSHALLQPAERTLLARISVFRNGFTLDAAEAVCSNDDSTDDSNDGIAVADVLPLLTALADQSLLVAEDSAGTTRFRMLETVWQYASARLLQAGAAEVWRSRHAAHALALVEAAEAGLKGAEQRNWLNRLELEHDNLRAALQWSLRGTAASDAGLRMAAVLWRFWSNRGYGSEGLEWMSRLLAAHGDQASPALRAKVRHGAGVLSFRLCDYPAADASFRAALAIRRGLQDAEGVADSLGGVSATAITQGRLDEGKATAIECLALRRQLGNARALAESLNNVATIAAMQGDMAAAAPGFDEAVQLHRQAGNDHGVARGLMNLGVASCHLGCFDDSARQLQEALRLHRSLGDGRAVAMNLLHLGNSAIAGGDLAGSRGWYGQCLADAREQADPLCVVELLHGVARLGLAGGHHRTAARLYGAAERRREELGAPIEPVDRPAHEARVAALRGAMRGMPDDDSAFHAAWRQGRAMDADEALLEAGSLC